MIIEIPKVIFSTQVKSFGLYSGSRNHVRNPEEMCDMNLEEEKQNNVQMKGRY